MMSEAHCDYGEFWNHLKKERLAADIRAYIHRPGKFHIPAWILFEFFPAEIRAEIELLPLVMGSAIRFILIDDHVAYRVSCHCPNLLAAGVLCRKNYKKAAGYY